MERELADRSMQCQQEHVDFPIALEVTAAGCALGGMPQARARDCHKSAIRAIDVAESEPANEAEKLPRSARRSRR